MAEAGKKRNRKSKLVPRDFTRYDKVTYHFPESQKIKSTIKKLLPRIKDKINDPFLDSSIDSSANFSVQIAVEPCEEFVDDNQLIWKELEITEVTISDAALRCETEKMMAITTSNVDKVIEIEIRNYWGKYVQAVEEVSFYHDKLIQDVLKKLGYGIVESILAYKCYICKVGWWHLGPFRDHIRQHKDINVDIKMNNNLYYIVANKQDVKADNDYVKIDGKCRVCLRTHDEHYTLNAFNNFRCNRCDNHLSTCNKLFAHENLYLRYTSVENYKVSCICKICGVECLTSARFSEHIQLRHTVRSDKPIILNDWKTCCYCRRKYIDIYSHACPHKKDRLKCVFCGRTFQTNQQVVGHVIYNLKRDCNCKVCGQYLKTQCLELQHMVTHSKNYVLVCKCIRCKIHVLCANKKALEHHSTRVHRRCTVYYEQIVVPVTCFSSKRTGTLNCENTLQKIDKTPDEPTTPADLTSLLATTQHLKHENDNSEQDVAKTKQRIKEEKSHEYIEVKKENNVENTSIKLEHEICLTEFDNSSEQNLEPKCTTSMTVEEDLAPEPTRLMNKVIIPVKVYSGKRINDDDLHDRQKTELTIEEEIGYDVENRSIEAEFDNDSSEQDLEPKCDTPLTINSKKRENDDRSNTRKPNKRTCNISALETKWTNSDVLQSSLTDTAEVLVYNIADDGNVQWEYVIDNVNDEDAISLKPEITDEFNDDSYLNDDRNDGIYDVQGETVIKSKSDFSQDKVSLKQIVNNSLDEGTALHYQAYEEKTDDRDNDEDSDIKADHEACMAELTKVYKQFQASKSTGRTTKSSLCSKELMIKHEPLDLSSDDVANKVNTLNFSIETSRHNSAPEEDDLKPKNESPFTALATTHSEFYRISVHEEFLCKESLYFNEDGVMNDISNKGGCS
ncbi:uncharacterized protein LOC126379382 isoform X2 [Pectinophora gossypiella]|uniref:uncharacterized protein LOC126379382 isoform X2 n=1 Tax=Pectinophora gossypiella TaxID=13191 RepID=UPI00214E091A|nr:uncharacterized protein LOC126379382 isoform X2 [Pectinophora gossypiella]